MATESTTREIAVSRTVVLILLRVAGAGLLVAMAWIHLYLWLYDGYRDVSPIGQLFMANVVGAGLLAIAIAVTPNRFLVLVATLCALFTAGTLGALLLSLSNTSLFGFHESIQAPLAVTTMVVEGAGVLVLGLLSVYAAVSVGVRRK
ncbi:MAG TPA: hypothetical protein VH352_02610 [Pseudonocardiaceae bacterium]|jgi:hypothetical protein|nr:hypothetical protein [Pseudonocardiaceae bacterium]